MPCHSHRIITQKGDAGLAATTLTHTQNAVCAAFCTEFANTSNMCNHCSNAACQLLFFLNRGPGKIALALKKMTLRLNDVRWDAQNPMISHLELHMAMLLNKQAAKMLSKFGVVCIATMIRNP